LANVFIENSIQNEQILVKVVKLVSCSIVVQWGAFYLFIANFFATQIIGDAKELVVLL